MKDRLKLSYAEALKPTISLTPNSTIPLEKIPIYNFGPTLFEQNDVLFTVPFADGPMQIEGKWLIYNVFFWRPLIRRGLAVTKDNLFYKTLLSTEEIKRLQLKTLKAVWAVNPDDPTIFAELFDVVNEIYNYTAVYLGSYQVTMDAFSLSRLLCRPEVKQLTSIDVSKEISVSATENKIKQAHNAMLDALKSGNIPDNVLEPFMKLDLLSTQQLPQVLVALGFRTDVNETTIQKPILSSFMSGMTDIIDYAIESLSAKKSVFYNKYNMAPSQYSNRMQQLLASSVCNLYPGHCGTTTTVPFHITAHNYRFVTGKNIIEDGKIVTLIDNSAEAYIGKVVDMLSPLTCLYTDGICKVCGGQLTDYMHKDIMVGFASVIELMGPIAQLILSSKHFSQTKSSVYTIPDKYQDMLQMRNNDIFFRNDVNLTNLVVGVVLDNMPRVNDLKTAKEGAPLNEQSMSDIQSLILADNKSKLAPLQVDMLNELDAAPFFTTDMLMYIKHNMNHVTVDNIIWIPMFNFDRKLPFMRCTIENESMIKFTANIRSMFEKDIANYHSVAEALGSFSSAVYRKVKTNIMHLEIILKSSLVTSASDWSIPVVTDINNVMFGKLVPTIQNRSIGPQMAFQGLGAYLANAATFTIPRDKNFMDEYLGMK